jgi:hypothetical protein
MDPLSEVFALIEIRTARCTRLEAGGTWALRFPASRPTIEKTYSPPETRFSMLIGNNNSGAKAAVGPSSVSYHSRKPTAHDSALMPASSCKVRAAAWIAESFGSSRWGKTEFEASDAPRMHPR